MNRLTSFKIQRRFFSLLKTKPYKLNDSTHEENSVIAFLFSYSANSSSLAPTISYILNFIWLFIIQVAFGATASYAFQGMGKGITSFLLTMQREAILVIIFTFILGISLSLGVHGVYYGLVIGNAIGSAVGLLCIEIFISHLLKKANS